MSLTVCGHGQWSQNAGQSGSDFRATEVVTEQPGGQECSKLVLKLVQLIQVPARERRVRLPGLQVFLGLRWAHKFSANVCVNPHLW